MRHMACLLAHAAWLGSSIEEYWRFRQALRNPAAAQRELLMRYLRDNADTVLGRQLGLRSIRSISEFQRCVPLSQYEDFAPLMDRIMAGDPAILTREPVGRLVPTSGSAHARKLIPYTATLQREFRRAIRAWIVDLYGRHPSLVGGPAYWSISPMGSFAGECESAVPIGFDDDTAYLGGFARRLVQCTLAVPSAVRLIEDIESSRYVTLAFLLRARGLRMISIWHPSFLTLLLEPISRFWESLIRDIRDGTLSPPAGLTSDVRTSLKSHMLADPHRARQLSRIDPCNFTGIWPRLGLISSWGDGHSTAYLDGLRREFPRAAIQLKGLVATEAIMTLPFGDSHPLAVRSHFFEFLSDDGVAHLAHEIETGCEYSVALTTGGGLCRYQLHDRVRVVGRCWRTPSLTFVGKDGGVCDRFGEKLSPRFVAQALNRVFAEQRLRPAFALLAPQSDSFGWRYVLHVDLADRVPAGLAEALECALLQNPHYRYCVALGQLKPAEVCRTAPGALGRYIDELCRRGQRAGEIKPSPLDSNPGWSKILGSSANQQRVTAAAVWSGQPHPECSTPGEARL